MAGRAALAVLWLAAAAMAADPPRSVDGAWESDWGPVVLRQSAPDASGKAAVTGTWEHGRRETGEIRAGAFDPAAGTLDLSYFRPWDGRDGTASLRLSGDGATLEGTAALRGEPPSRWVLRRAAATPAPAPVPAAAKEDEEGDPVEGAGPANAESPGTLVTLESWRARLAPDASWNERKVPAPGAPLTAPGAVQEFGFRVVGPRPAGVEVRWWRADRPGSVRAFTEKNGRLALEAGKDGALRLRFEKPLASKVRYVFAILLRDADGATRAERFEVVRDRPEKPDAKKAGGKKE